MSAAPQIVWFKRDLRVQDHAPLFAAAEAGAPVLPLYIVEPELWQQPFASARHWHFIHDCLTELDASLRKLGQPLVVRIGPACEVLKALAEETGARTLWAHEETADLWTFRRDMAVHEMCRVRGIAFRELPSNGVVRRLKGRDDWSRIRNTRMAAPVTPRPARLVPAPPVATDALPPKDHPMFGAPLAQPQKGGRRAAIADLQSFLENRAEGYLRHISSPLASAQHCSRLSAHLAWGSLSAREVDQALKRRQKALSPLEKASFGRNLSAFGSRLAWRCHFIQKLEDQPSLETRCMHPAFEGMREPEHDPARFAAWAEGRTGFPFIDACMRSLIHTGWITFRMRAMLVSFASYQLWLDWRKTAPHMARLFTDYEPGIHYSQFQMQSGVTGINAMRVYNPLKQSLDQDPQGSFIRRWIPELRALSDEAIHAPWAKSATLFDGPDKLDYPAPIVDHIAAARYAKERISAVKKEAGFRTRSNAVFEKHGSRKKSAARKPAKASDAQLDLF